jgi:hypothetical protein
MQIATSVREERDEEEVLRNKAYRASDVW